MKLKRDQSSSQFIAQVRDLSLQGLGVVDHPEGRVYFVPGVWPGDEGEFVIESQSKTYGFARLQKLIKASAERRSQIPCPYQGHSPDSCGGCPWMLATDMSQLRAKEQLLRSQLKRQGFSPGEDFEIGPIWPSPQALGYRNRAQFKTDGQKLGFVSAQSQELVEVEDCLVLSPQNRQTLRELRAQLPRADWRPQPGRRWSSLDIDEDLKASEVVANRRRPFRQGNSSQNQRMRQWLRDSLSPQSRSAPVLELFCGSGNFTQVISELGFQTVWAVEGRGQALENLKALRLAGVQTMELDLLAKGSVGPMAQSASSSQILVLDPPREGFPALKHWLPHFPHWQDIYYISCEMGGWGRDAATLREAGFALRQVQPLDQFPQTPYLEILSHFQKI